MTTVTSRDISYDGQTLDLDDGLTARIETHFDESMGAPWDNEDGHGPVSDWENRDKASGERILSVDRCGKRFYDFAEAVKIAKRDGWDAAPYHSAFPNETKGEQAVRAVEADFKHLYGWANDNWHYIGVSVTLFDADECEIGRDSLWGIEDYGDYWRECAAEMVNELIRQQATETTEREHWEARDTVTV